MPVTHTASERHSERPARVSSSRASRLGIAVLLSLLVPTPPPAAHAFVVQPAIAMPSFPYRAKEFCVVRKDGVFHLFYTRDDLTASFANSTKDLGHFVSRDLFQWTELPPILPVRENKWDNSHVWAPHIVVTDSLYYMFYAGVTKIPGVADEFQQIGLATSTDLVNWTRLDAPVFTCDQAAWTYCDARVPLGGNFRDPWVMPDPDSTGRWLLLYAGLQDSITGQMMIGVATSSGDLTQWRDHGPVTSTGWANSFSFLIESPLALPHAGLWYLFYTTDSGHPINYETTPDLLAPAGQWSSQRRLFQECPGTDDFYGPEGFTVGAQTFFGAADEATGAALMWEIVFDDAPHFHFVTPAVVGVGQEPGPAALRFEASPRADRAGDVRFTLEVPADTHGRLAVFDLQGRVVATVHEGPLGRGARVFAWHADGASGVYFARLETPLGRRSARFAITR